MRFAVMTLWNREACSPKPAERCTVSLSSSSGSTKSGPAATFGAPRTSSTTAPSGISTP